MGFSDMTPGAHLHYRPMPHRSRRRWPQHAQVLAIGPRAPGVRAGSPQRTHGRVIRGLGAAADWHDFYLLAGGAAATLAGLVFFALSPRPEALDEDARPGARSLARQLFGNFVVVLLLSIIVLVPGQGHEALGLGFTLAGLLGVTTTLPRVRRIGRIRGRGPRVSVGPGSLAHPP